MHRFLECILDERSAATVTRFLASSRALSKSFDKYLQQVQIWTCTYSDPNNKSSHKQPFGSAVMNKQYLAILLLLFSIFRSFYNILGCTVLTFSLQLLRVLNEPAVHVRTRAMKALSTIIAADPSILSRVG